MHHHEEDEKPVQKKVYGYKDLETFQSSNLYSSVGKMLIATMPSAPLYGFGTSDRQKQKKVYISEDLSRTHFIGKTSPGPNYEVRNSDKYNYNSDPQWTVGKEVRGTLGTGAKYAHHSRKDTDFDPIQADNARKWNTGNIKIGLESRFEDPKKHKNTPGPEYDPCIRPDVPSPTKYSFGVRRDVKGGSPLILLTSTPNAVGPGSYIKAEQPNTSTMNDHPHFSMPKDKKLKPADPGCQKNQTYDTRSAFGAQHSSPNKSYAQVSFGKAHKDSYTGTFKDMMAKQPTRIRIEHPKF